jgi:ABC-type transport system involved in multi-copper enzyme maturation permease subunit
MRLLARRKRYHALRLLALLAIVGLWWVDYWTLIQVALRQSQFALAVGGTVYYGGARQALSASQLNHTLALHGHEYLWHFIQVSGLLVGLLTPPLVIAAINEERQRGTMDLLMTSDLSPLEVILGKTLPRVLLLGLIAIGSLNVPMMSSLMGGFHGDWVLTTGIALLSLLFSLAALAALLAALGLSTAVALLFSYALVTGWMVLGWNSGAEAEPTIWTWVNGLALARLMLTPVSTLAPPPLTSMALVQAALHVVVGIGLFCLAGKKLRQGNERSAAIRPLRWWRGRRPPLTGDEPLLWKERGPAARWVWLTWLSTALGIGLAFPLWLTALAGKSDSRVWQWQFYQDLETWLWLVGSAALLLPVVSVATRAAWSVRHEFDRATWETLLTTPTSLPRILRAKWWGALLASLPAISAGAAMWMITLLLGVGLVLEKGRILNGNYDPQLVSLSAGIVLMFGVAMFATSVGLFMSVVCQTAVRAVVSTYVSLIVFFGLPPLFVFVSTDFTAEVVEGLLNTFELLIWSGLPIIAVLTLALFSVRLRLALHAFWRLVGLPVMFGLSLQFPLFFMMTFIIFEKNGRNLYFGMLSPVEYARFTAETVVHRHRFSEQTLLPLLSALIYPLLAYAVWLATRFLALRRSERLGDRQRRLRRTVPGAEATATLSAPATSAMASVSS